MQWHFPPPTPLWFFEVELSYLFRVIPSDPLSVASLEVVTASGCPSVPAVSLDPVRTFKKALYHMSSLNSVSCWDSHCYTLQHAGKIIITGILGPYTTNLFKQTNEQTSLWYGALHLLDVTFVESFMHAASLGGVDIIYPISQERKWSLWEFRNFFKVHD